ncbi:hypothetical protein HYDPIDRAFT_29478 [Hydnomerulius pinastri MD-312]|uniref:Unplaced genomic scaffold scaffold_16, whole genome shotgun sequence n=1 Tax=Hydnomerulius pinastri MD-312 TaxID=994086 RepID=A0A0C9W8D6_9AGAM|nr:hypothetical protein HYDPIDRAFT_29478 [Hydnomerulius pinastri MD-312]
MGDIPSTHAPLRSGLRRAYPPDFSQLQEDSHRAKITKITLQITINKISPTRCLPHTNNLRVGVCVDELTKLSCVGNFVSSGRRSVVAWNHPFTFTGSLASTVSIYLSTLPQPGDGWMEEHIGQEIKLDACQLLLANSVRYYCVPGLDGAPRLHISVNVTTPMVTDHDCFKDLQVSAAELWDYHKKYNNGSALNSCIELEQASLDLCPPGHPDQHHALANLASSLWTQYNLLGSQADLELAIDMEKQVLDLLPPGHPDRHNALANLASSLQTQYKLLGSQADLELAIDMEKQVLDLLPPGHPARHHALADLAFSLQTQYKLLGSQADLELAIDMQKQVLDLCPPGHPD